MKTYLKNSAGELQETETKEEVKTYTLEWLNEQQKQLKENLAWINALKLEAEKVGVKLKVAEEII